MRYYSCSSWYSLYWSRVQYLQQLEYSCVYNNHWYVFPVWVMVSDVNNKDTILSVEKNKKQRCPSTMFPTDIAHSIGASSVVHVILLLFSIFIVPIGWKMARKYPISWIFCMVVMFANIKPTQQKYYSFKLWWHILARSWFWLRCNPREVTYI